MSLEEMEPIAINGLMGEDLAAMEHELESEAQIQTREFGLDRELQGGIAQVSSPNANAFEREMGRVNDVVLEDDIRDVGNREESTENRQSLSCPFLPGFGTCCDGHIHRELLLTGQGPYENCEERYSVNLVPNTEDREKENNASSFLSPLKEARTVIRVCEDGGLCFRNSERKLIERSMVEIESSVGRRQNILRSAHAQKKGAKDRVESAAREQELFRTGGDGILK
ncbi:hypothetical protein PIB30_011181 [Stylosanthes scabra]|uniref:Uncharacterized protein n=1 Tax=Stylosanthes scabra TaxID=79078 RepID=A0ABU6R5G0_9FABA|nr:hypothetical protein [Stylosanthes scabra]